MKMNKDACPICGKNHNIVDMDKGTRYDCESNKQYYLHESIFCNTNQVETERGLNAIYNFVETKPYLRKNGMNYYWLFYYDENNYTDDNENQVNVYFLMQEYPLNVADRIDKILLNLAYMYPSLSDTFNTIYFNEAKFRLLYCESKNRLEEINGIFSVLMDSKYIELVPNNSNNEYVKECRITLAGWKRVAELRKTNELSKQGFIAMSFDPQVKYIEDCFKKAISEAGYKPQIIKDKEHNNYIMPEIFYEIKQSRFVVVDITKPNYGAYYEAGYAQALGKEVIVCCKQEVFDNPDTKPHFDIAQKSMIIWKDEEDLIARLKNRIIATVNQ